MNLRLDLLKWEVRQISHWLSLFGAMPVRWADLAPSGQTLRVSNFPLPDRYRPDRVDLALSVGRYPLDPPKGLYLLAAVGNAPLLAQLRRQFNVFADQAFHGAPAIAGSQWICVGFLEGWRFNASAPHRGDNIQKMLKEFWRLLEETP